MHNNKSTNSTKKIALAAVLTAGGVVFLFAGSVLQVVDLSAAALAGFAVALSVIEIGGKYPVLVYLAVSLISVLILPNRLPAVLFIAFGGLYPLFKAQFERYHPVVAWVLKFSMFNIVLWLLIFFIGFLTGQELMSLSERMDFLGYFTIVAFLLGNLVFLLYDIVMTKLIILYMVKIRKILKLENYF